jgi:hypothetical protein
MATRPIVPVFAFQDSSLSNLQALSDSAAFVSTTPMGWHFGKSGTQTLTAGVNTQITFGGVNMFDPDGVLSGGAAVVATRGYYDCEATLPFPNTASANQTAQAAFRVVTGSNNPGGAGNNITFGSLCDLTTGNGDEISLTLFGTSPCLYPGDSVQVWLKVTGTGVVVSNTWNSSGNNDLGGFPDGGAYFTGQWVSEGP